MPPSVFFNDPATTEISPLSLPDALPILDFASAMSSLTEFAGTPACRTRMLGELTRSEEHTSELQARLHLVCRLLFFLMIRRPPRSPLFPSPTLFRSWTSRAQ